MRSRRRLSIKAILLLCLITASGAAYFHFGLFPGDLKKTALLEIMRATHKRVDFTKVLYLPFRGLSFYDLSVREMNGAPVFSARRLSLDIKLIPFFTEEKIVIPRVLVDSPVYDHFLERPDTAPPSAPPTTAISGQIPIPVIPEDKKVGLNVIKEGPDALTPENVYLERIEIQNGRVTVRRDASGPVIERINDIHLRMGFQKPPLLDLDGSVKLGSSPYAVMTLKGVWNLKRGSYNFDFQTRSELVPAWMLDYQRDHFLILKNGRFVVNTHLENKGEGPASFTASAQLKDSVITVKQGRYSGQMGLRVSGQFDVDSRKFKNYRGELDLVRVDVNELSKDIRHLEAVSGSVRFEPDLLDIASLRGRYKNLAFDAAGTIRSFKELALQAQIRTDLEMEELLSLLPEENRGWLKDFEVRGQCEAVTRISGSLRQASELNKTYLLRLKGGSLNDQAKKIQISGISGDVGVDAAGYKIQNARFSAGGGNYELEAFIPSSTGQAGTFSTRSPQLAIDASFLMDGRSIVFQQASLKQTGLTASFKGKLASLADPVLQVRGDVHADLDAVTAGLASRSPELKDLGLAGSLSGPFTLNGFWNDPLRWDLKIDASGAQVFLKKTFRLDNFEMQVRMKDGVVGIPYLHALAYQGSVGAEAAFDLRRPGTAFDSKLSLNGIDLAKLINALQPGGKKDISGTLNLQTTLGGTLKSQETYQGAGALDIRNGKLWQTDLFKAMGHLPFVKVEGLDLVQFHDMNGHFTIREKKLWTQDLNLFSDTVALLLKGSMGFDQALDFLMTIRFSNDVIRGAYDTGGFVPFVVQKAEDSISKYQISGNLKEPKFQKAGLA